ncbi:transposase family protein [Acetobacterium carbinolicum]|uniref:transposase family protein n=1 Tax=Acetobacterium carbinolicum TaxID=52690 RepID=UPI0039BFC52A
MEVIETDKIIIHMKSLSKTCVCPRCHQTLKHYHGTYTRKIQDLPILGKNVQLRIKAHEYICDNEACPVRTVAETFDDFLNTNRRMTQRCEDFICMLAYEAQPVPVCSETIGVDDFAFKKKVDMEL